ncbi:Intraflagellar transport protein 43 like [Schistosoma japonicum]|nr:Intraflagellar transport protein 43 like [Schistosoma japonicum]
MADGLEMDGLTKFAKMGRRAKETLKDRNYATFNDNNSQKTVGNNECTDLPERKIAGWNDDDSSCIASFVRAHEGVQDVCSTVQKEGSDEELEIPIIPDLLNVKDSSLDITGAVAPSVVINKIPSYRELSQDLFGRGTLPLMDNDIDLRVLTKHLCSKSELREVRLLLLE